MRRTILSIVVLLALAGCGGSSSATSAPTTSTKPVLADGSTETPSQAAYLAAVNPSLTPEHAADVLKVLKDGQGVCDTYIHPSAPASQQLSVDVLMQYEAYTLTEATVITRAAATHLCPGK